MEEEECLAGGARAAPFDLGLPEEDVDVEVAGDEAEDESELELGFFPDFGDLDALPGCFLAGADFLGTEAFFAGAGASLVLELEVEVGTTARAALGFTAGAAREDDDDDDDDEISTGGFLALGTAFLGTISEDEVEEEVDV
jgi:hypothetical protein